MLCLQVINFGLQWKYTIKINMFKRFIENCFKFPGVPMELCCSWYSQMSFTLSLYFVIGRQDLKLKFFHCLFFVQILESFFHTFQNELGDENERYELQVRQSQESFGYRQKLILSDSEVTLASVIVIAEIEFPGSAVNVHSRNLVLTLQCRYEMRCGQGFGRSVRLVCMWLRWYHLFYNSAIKMDMSE